MSGGVRVIAPAKINLHLGVGAVRDDGYHEVDTVLHAIALHDVIEIRPPEGERRAGVPEAVDRFTCEPDVGLPSGRNLAYRAAQDMVSAFGHPFTGRIDVRKSIPAGAGLGGASADAAAVISGLAALWGVPCDDPRLAHVAAGLGADVPFFLAGGAARFTGRGDRLERCLRPLEAALVLVKPDEPVSTAEAYAAFDRLGAPAAPADAAGMISALEAGDLIPVATLLRNEMTRSSAGLVPAIGEALAILDAADGVYGASMAGSGSAVFGLCADAAAADRAAAAACDAGFWALSTRTSAAGCRVEPL